MMSCMHSILRRLNRTIGAGSVLFACHLAAQPGDSAPTKTETSRLQLMENTYQTNLRKFHTPILADYLRDLERLKQTLLAKDRTEDAKKVDEEILKVKKQGSTTGTFDFPVPKKESPPATPDLAGVKPPRRMAANAITLQATDATVSTARGTAITKDAPIKAVLIGEAIWKNVNIPAGTYDILAVRATADIDTPRTVTVSVGGQTITRTLKPNDTTGSEDAFRILRLGNVTFEKDVASDTLKLSVDQPDKPILWVRSVIIGQPKPKPAP